MSDGLGHRDLAQLACLLEATARKPGNVHRCRGFADAGFLDFAVSASVLARHLDPKLVRGFGVGGVVLRAVRETRGLVGHNTNLGMILLLTPMAGVRVRRRLREGLARILDRLSVADTVAVYEAIRLARPGGLGEAPEQDVADEPTVTLREAMGLAADRDAIARQYATGYADVFDLALPTLGDALRAGRPLEAAIVLTHLTLMAGRPDTLIARKRGEAVARESARRAAGVLASGWPDGPGSVEAIREFDEWLRADGHARNPGATADLIAATLYAALCDGTIEFPRHLSGEGWDAGDRL
ncbi:triphosphoribosyl-dephospho-CoA synthase [Tautonia plasticadhaerens]|uniref:Triphosphoribosyl-dephospho-CoA synthase n=1 Tax=Tautonia plasticadhaerens TaxID=2527974 RepID=A0A518HAT3_9BACT|nr:triphosphoribosyl-dephospho-CoA synthase [Tautonia plasticadhaerens]QDV37958.1 triphosphoribosyl-dephospho-CoA synthase [Tautonia plasticadhaerens]